MNKMSTSNSGMSVRGNLPVPSQPGSLELMFGLPPAEQRILAVAKTFAETLDEMLLTIGSDTGIFEARAVGVDGLEKGHYAAAVTARESGQDDYFRIQGGRNVTYEIAVGIVEKAGTLPRSLYVIENPKEGCVLKPAYVVKFQLALLHNQRNTEGLASQDKGAIDELLSEVFNSAEASKTGEARINQSRQPDFTRQPDYTATLLGKPAAHYDMHGQSRTKLYSISRKGVQHLLRKLEEANDGALPRMGNYQQRGDV